MPDSSRRSEVVDFHPRERFESSLRLDELPFELGLAQRGERAMVDGVRAHNVTELDERSHVLRPEA